MSTLSPLSSKEKKRICGQIRSPSLRYWSILQLRVTRRGTEGGQNGGVKQVLGQEVTGKCVVLALGGCGVRTGREKRGGCQGRCWGCMRISDFSLGTVYPHAQWQTLNQKKAGIIGEPRGKCYQESSLCTWDRLVSSSVSSLEMKHICKTQEIYNKSLRNSKLGVDWSVELQLWRPKNAGEDDLGCELTTQEPPFI